MTTLLLAVLSGLLIGLAWRTEKAGWAGVCGIALFLFVQTRIRALSMTLWHAYLTGWTSFAIACPWLPATARYLTEIDEPTSLAMSAVYYSWQSASLILFAFIWRYFRSEQQAAWMLVPVIWRGLGELLPTLFPWPPAVLLTGDLAMLQLAELGGEQLASMLVLAIAGFFAWTGQLWSQYFAGLKTRPRVLPLWSMIFLSLIVIRLAGNVRLNQIEAALEQAKERVLRIGLVQVDTRFSDSNQRMIETTRAMSGLIDLTVWPESALGDYSRALTDFKDAEQVERLSVGVDTKFVPFPEPNCPLLAGADTWEDDDGDGKPERHFVSALVIDRKERLVGSREKTRLMPYGEYIPGEAIFPFLRKWFGSQRLISPGTTQEPIARIGGFQLGVLLCCEDMHPELARQMVLRGANILVTLGNGMAFDSELPLRQHFRIAQVRAIENRTSFLRCTSSGVSGLITPSGRVCFELPAMRDAAAILPVPIPLDDAGHTLFTKRGRLVPFILALAAALAWMRKRLRVQLTTSLQPSC